MPRAEDIVQIARLGQLIGTNRAAQRLLTLEHEHAPAGPGEQSGAGKHGEAGLLASCYRTCFEMAEERKAGSISFPAISTGAYGYPVAQAAAVALEAVSQHLAKLRLAHLVNTRRDGNRNTSAIGHPA